jgi:hypothetical protein
MIRIKNGVFDKNKIMRQRIIIQYYDKAIEYIKKAYNNICTYCKHTFTVKNILKMAKETIIHIIKFIGIFCLYIIAIFLLAFIIHFIKYKCNLIVKIIFGIIFLMLMAFIVKKIFTSIDKNINRNKNKNNIFYIAPNGYIYDKIN